MEVLESVGPRPRQARYRAALRPDMHCFIHSKALSNFAPNPHHRSCSRPCTNGSLHGDCALCRICFERRHVNGRNLTNHSRTSVAYPGKLKMHSRCSERSQNQSQGASTSPALCCTEIVSRRYFPLCQSLALIHGVLRGGAAWEFALQFPQPAQFTTEPLDHEADHPHGFMIPVTHFFLDRS